MYRLLLKSACANKTLIGIRTTSQDWGESIIGFILNLDELFCTINEIDEYGFSIGNTIIEIENIITIDVEDRYIKRLKFIYDYASTFRRNASNTVWKEGAMLIPHFMSLIENSIITTLYFDEDEFVTRIITKFDGDQIMVNNIGNEGDDDGFSCHHFEKLTGLRFDSLEEQKIRLLYDNRELFYNH